jgi:hypothetical protein
MRVDGYVGVGVSHSEGVSLPVGFEWMIRRLSRVDCRDASSIRGVYSLTTFKKGEVWPQS